MVEPDQYSQAIRSSPSPAPVSLEWKQRLQVFAWGVQSLPKPHTAKMSANFSVNFINAFHSLGISTPKDPGAGVKSGVFWGPSSLDPSGETRSDARAAHYEPVKQRSNYHIKANTMVSKIVISNGSASGVIGTDKTSGKQYHWKATKEVVLAAGAVHSPQILELSGIGAKKLLHSLGITPVNDLEGVGENFQDHATLYLGYDCEFDFRYYIFPAHRATFLYVDMLTDLKSTQTRMASSPMQQN